MTTIAWRQGVLASDCQASSGGLVTKATKLFSDQHFAIGVSGSLSHGLAFRRWFFQGMKGDCPLDDDTYALVMNLQTGECEQWETPGIGIPVEDEFAAIGSGREFAYGAMHMGADAQMAIIVASRWDASTGMGVQVFRCEDTSP